MEPAWIFSSHLDVASCAEICDLLVSARYCLFDIINLIYNILLLGTAKYQPGATSLKFHFHSDETIEKSGFKIAFEQVFDCTPHYHYPPERTLPHYY